MRFLSFFRREKIRPFDAPLDVPAPVAVIGDIHGCDQLLAQLLDKIAQADPTGIQIVCVGDYIDRGDGSAAVIDLLLDRPDIICLKGNHEAMCLRFLDDPDKHGARWLQYGGLQTLASYGVAGPAADGTRPFQRVRDDLALAMGDRRITWMQDLATSWRSGNLLITHAGADPARGPDDQRPQDMIWGCAAFDATPRTDGLWVAHGHVIQDTPTAQDGRIAVDTGAYATGRLTAAILGNGPPHFQMTG